jgi:DNA-binding NarL/FixJ family response regulator
MIAGRDRAGPVITAVLVAADGPEPVDAGVRVLGRAASVATATLLVTQHRPQLVIVDLDGIAAALSVIDAVTTGSSPVPVLALTATPDHAAVLTAVRAGATSLLVAAAPDDVAATARRTVAGEAVFSPGLAEVVLAEFGRPAGQQPGARLTERESDVVRLVVEGLTARQIGTRLGLSPRTVDNHVQHVLRKLQLRGRAALIRYAIEHGLA